jgi:hypothetical protein
VNHINVQELMGTFPLNSFIALDFFILEHHIYLYQEHL